MKILIASFTFPPNKDGVSEASAVLAKGLADKGWQVEVTSAPTIPPRETTIWNGVKIHEISITGDGSPKRPFRGDVEKYRILIKQGDWDVIVFQTYIWPILCVLDLIPRIRAKTILVSHGYAPLQWIRTKKFPFGVGVWMWNILQSAKMLFWLKRIDRVVFLSSRKDFNGFFDHLLSKIALHRGGCIIPNGIDPNVRCNDPDGFRDAYDINRDAFVFICVANYSRRKDQAFAAKAFREAAIPGSILVFIGSEFNEYSDAYQKDDQLRYNGTRAERILWLEKLDRETTLNAIGSANAFVLSSNHEAQPIALLEAMREEKPWIARSAGCISEMPGGICVQTISEMSRAMIDLATNSRKCIYLGKVGKNSVDKIYNIKTYLKSYVKIIEEISH